MGIIAVGWMRIRGISWGLKADERFTITQDKYNVNLNDGMSSQNFLS
jgi:hypothetical protein